MDVNIRNKNGETNIRRKRRLNEEETNEVEETSNEE